MKDKIKQLSIDASSSISSALQKMDAIERKLLIVTDKERFYSILSIGDIQRAIIKGVDLKSPIINILRDEVGVASPKDDMEAVRQTMLMERNEYMPIVDEWGNVEKVLFWEDLFSDHASPVKKKLQLPVLIMAGGIGSRLRPLTNVFPKALIPIGEKSIIEQIIDSFIEYDCRDYYVSVNHKAEMIKFYLKDGAAKGIRISYLEEDDFWGTAGSIRLLEPYVDSTFFVSNCDILVDQDYADILEFHKANRNEITIVGAMMSQKLPYGVMHTDNNGMLIRLEEKPEFFYKINTGLYILEPSIFVDIPQGEVCQITDIILKLIGQERRVGIFPVSENSWTDMGNWNEFLKQTKVLE